MVPTSLLVSLKIENPPPLTNVAFFFNDRSLSTALHNFVIFTKHIQTFQVNINACRLKGLQMLKSETNRTLEEFIWAVSEGANRLMLMQGPIQQLLMLMEGSILQLLVLMQGRILDLWNAPFAPEMLLYRLSFSDALFLYLFLNFWKSVIFTWSGLYLSPDPPIYGQR